MPQTPQTFTVADPRSFDGDPYEVAERAFLQAAAVATILAACIDNAAIMARNAQLERNLQETKNDARASEWEDSAQSRAINRNLHEARGLVRSLQAAAKAAGFNPKKPPKE